MAAGGHRGARQRRFNAAVRPGLPQIGRGHLYSLESNGEFARATRERIEAMGLAELVTLIDTPIADCRLPDAASVRWYSAAALAELPARVCRHRWTADGKSSGAAYQWYCSRVES